MKIVVGLGNPGDKYRATRHNVGFRAVDLLAERHGGTFEAKGDLGDKAWTARVTLAGAPVVLAKPRTFMNRSGSAVLALLRKYPVEPKTDLIVVFDDADLELGKVRVRPEGGHGGQNGMRSILEVIGTREFLRVKLGIKGVSRLESDLADYVLGPFDPEERPVVENMIVAGADAVEALVASAPGFC
ncbi:MAG TPA: aminoacyl-tRNA hydrolase [Candidatus Polarisedimenticolaceae bacterium]